MAVYSSTVNTTVCVIDQHNQVNIHAAELVATCPTINAKLSTQTALLMDAGMLTSMYDELQNTNITSISDVYISLSRCSYDLVCCPLSMQDYQRDVSNIAFFNQLCTQKQPLSHLLGKVIPKRCQTRRMDVMIHRYITTHPAVRTAITDMTKCSLLGNYSFSRVTTRPMGALRAKIYKQCTHQWVDIMVQVTKHLSEFILRDYFIFTVESDPVLMKHIRGLWDFDEFKKTVCGAMSDLRQFVNRHLRSSEFAALDNSKWHPYTSDDTMERLFVPLEAETAVNRMTTLGNRINGLLESYHQSILEISYRSPTVAVTSILTSVRTKLPVVHAPFVEVKRQLQQAKIAQQQIRQAARKQQIVNDLLEQAKLQEFNTNALINAERLNALVSTGNLLSLVEDTPVYTVAHQQEHKLPVDDSDDDMEDETGEATHDAENGDDSIVDALELTEDIITGALNNGSEWLKLQATKKDSQNAERKEEEERIKRHKNDIVVSTLLPKHQRKALREWILRLVEAGMATLPHVTSILIFFGIDIDTARLIHTISTTIHSAGSSYEQLESLLIQLHTASIHGYHLLHCAHDLLKDLQRVRIHEQLSYNYVCNQLIATKKRLNIQNTPCVAQPLVEFTFCRVCDRPYSLITDPKSTSTKSYEWGLRNSSFDYATGKRRCRPNKKNNNTNSATKNASEQIKQRNRKCRNTELTSVFSIGRIISFVGKPIMICPQPRCGKHMLIDQQKCMFTEFGIACCDCTKAIKQHEEAELFSGYTHNSHDRKNADCIMCDKRPTDGSAVIIYYWQDPNFTNSIDLPPITRNSYKKEVVYYACKNHCKPRVISYMTERQEDESPSEKATPHSSAYIKDVITTFIRAMTSERNAMNEKNLTSNMQKNKRNERNQRRI